MNMFIGLALTTVVCFLLLAVVFGWLSKPKPHDSATSRRDHSRAFDWQTALVFLVSGIGAYWLPSLLLPQSAFEESPWIGTLLSFAILGTQGVWLRIGRSGPGVAWLFITVFQGGLFLCSQRCQHLEGLASMQMEMLDVWICGWALVAKFGVLSRHYKRAWLLVLVEVCMRITYQLLIPHLQEAQNGFMVSYALHHATVLLTALAMGLIVARPVGINRRAARTTLKGEKRVQFLNAFSSLKKCRPLEDPVRTVRSISVLCGLLIGLPALAIACAVLIVSRNDDVRGVAVGLIIPAAQMSVLGITIFLLTPRSSSCPNAFIVRAFRRDGQTTRLRDLVSVALGPKGRLLGIRDPRRRFGMFTRLFALIEGALRYLGSNHCDLEGADRNWLARVLSTLYFRDIDFVIIDLREITDAVTVEVKVVSRAMTPHRVIWLMDESQTREEWLRRIHLLTEGGIDADAPVHLLDVRDADDPKSRAVIGVVNAVLKGSPHLQGSAETQEALAQAHALARTHVAEEEWKTPWIETLSGGFWISALAFILLNLLFHGLALDPLVMVFMVLLALTGLVLLMRTLISAVGAIGYRRKLKRLGRELAPEMGW